MAAPVTFVLTITGGDYGGHEVRLNDQVIGHRPYDGSRPDDVNNEVAAALAAILRERLGWPETDPRGDYE